jgi:hypothetical protein
VYFLTHTELARQANLNNPYQVSGSRSIAKRLQDQCEEKGRVRYPIRIESDSLDTVGRLDQMVDGLANFVEECLNLQPSQYTWWYSGRRSIHVHTPLFVKDQERQQFKEAAKEYNASEGSDVEVDVSNFGLKNQFRLPHVEHAKTGSLKVQIDPAWSHERIFREARQASASVPDNYSEVLDTVHTQKENLLQSVYGASSDDRGSQTPVRGKDSNTEFIKESSREAIIEAEAPSSRLWFAYNAKEFSPYAHTGGENSRSMAVVKVLDGAFCRPEYSEEARLPCEFLTAVGGNRNFTKRRELAPLLLGKQDYEKIANEVETGDFLVVIGGRSRNSRIYNVVRDLALLFSQKLHENGFKAAREAMEKFGYPTGSSSASKTSSSEGSAMQSTSAKSGAAKKKNRVEQDGVETIGHVDLLRIGNHLLQTEGWDGAWEWFQMQFGEDFDAETAHRQLQSIVSRYDDLSHVDVPPSPD